MEDGALTIPNFLRHYGNNIVGGSLGHHLIEVTGKHHVCNIHYRNMINLKSQTSLNRILWLSIITRITLEIELFTALNCFAVQLKLKNLREFHFCSS